MISDTLNFIEKHMKCPKVCLIGHSLSGMLFASFATILSERVESVVMLDSPIEKLDQQNMRLAMISLLEEVRQTILSEKIGDLEQARKRASEIVNKLTQDEQIKNRITSSLVVDENNQIDWR